MSREVNDTVYVGGPDGVFRTNNGGVTWALIDPLDPARVYMGISCASGIGAESSGGTRRSSNAGQDWEPVVDGPCVADLMRFDDGRLALVGPAYDAPVFLISRDQGQTWAAGRTGMLGDPNDLELSSNGQTVYVATTLGMYKSVTGGL